MKYIKYLIYKVGINCFTKYAKIVGNTFIFTDEKYFDSTNWHGHTTQVKTIIRKTNRQVRYIGVRRCGELICMHSTHFRHAKMDVLDNGFKEFKNYGIGLGNGIFSFDVNKQKHKAVWGADTNVVFKYSGRYLQLICADGQALLEEDMEYFLQNQSGIEILSCEEYKALVHHCVNI